MKRTILLLFVLLFTLSSYAQNNDVKIGEYGYGNYLRAEQREDGIRLSLTAKPGKYNKYAYMYFWFKDISFLRTQLTKLREKYIEWDSVATANNVESLTKKMDIPFPKFSVMWVDVINSPHYYSNVKPVSTFYRVGKSSYVMIDATYIECYLMFMKIEEIDQLIELLDPVSIKNALESAKNKEDLFK